MHSILSRLLVPLGGLLLLVQPALAAEQKDVKTYGDWGHVCEKAPGGDGEFCYVFQNVTKKEGGQLVLGARVAYRAEQKDPLLVLTVPLGTLLPPGAALVIEGSDPLQLPFFLCAADGCTSVATPIPAALLGAMKKGDSAVVRVAAPNKQVVGLPLSLKGFTKALGTIQK